MNKKIKIPFETKSSLNKHYIVEIPSTTMRKHDYKSIFGDHKAFIPMLIDRGSCFTLHDIEYKITEFNFWNKEQFEDRCRYVFFTFKDSFLAKLINQIASMASDEARYYLDALEKFSKPYDF